MKIFTPHVHTNMGTGQKPVESRGVDKETTKLTLPQKGVIEVQYSVVLQRSALQLNIVQLKNLVVPRHCVLEPR